MQTFSYAMTVKYTFIVIIISRSSCSTAFAIQLVGIRLSFMRLELDSIRGLWFSGGAFYKNLGKYVLTEEQLEENGYPCPDPEEKGKAIVKKVLIYFTRFST